MLQLRARRLTGAEGMPGSRARKDWSPPPGPPGRCPGTGGLELLVSSQQLKTTHDCHHKPRCRHTWHVHRAQAPDGSPDCGAQRRPWGATTPRPPPTRCRAPQWTPTQTATRATVLRGDQSAGSGIRNLEDANAAAGPAILGRAEQTDSCPGGGSGWHSRHFSTSINQPAQAEEGKARGRGRVGPHCPLPTLWAAPSHPGLAPAGSHWDWRHLLGRRGMSPRAPGAGWAGQAGLRHSLVSPGAVLRARAWSLSPPLQTSVSSSVNWGEWGYPSHPPAPSCGQGPTGQLRENAWHRAQHTASAE